VSFRGDYEFFDHIGWKVLGDFACHGEEIEFHARHAVDEIP
jgi:hypothetical protein